ncbi:pilin [Patescibacteria group bacterium]|nr:pilin [Patescibacteria group bacterium]
MKKIVLFSLLLLPLSAKAAVEVPNPLSADSIPELAGQMIRGLLGISGALALFFLVWGGILWMTSSGNSERVKKGKDSIVWAILGLVVIFLSYIVINFVFDILRGTT